MNSRRVSRNSSNESEPTGVSARLIENWLTNTPERGFEIPFSQLLLTQGHTIVHIDAHSPHEQGKDIVSLDSDGRTCGYQLKQGDITGARWDKEVFPELQQLVELAARHPRVEGNVVLPHLVTTGVLNDTAQQRLRDYNSALRGQSKHQVELFDRYRLTVEFGRIIGGLIPEVPADMRELLTLYLEDGGECLDGVKFWQIISNAKGITKQFEWKRLVCQLPILCGFLLSSAYAQRNHYRQAEAWTLTAGRLAGIAGISRLPDGSWQSSFVLCRDAARVSLRDLCDEALSLPRPEAGSFYGDGGPVWSVRATIVVGCLATHCLIARVERHADLELEEKVFAFVAKWWRPFVWGESIAAHLWPLYWLERCHADRRVVGENRLIDFMQFVASQKGQYAGREIPSTYFTPRQCLEREWAVSELVAPANTTHHGHCYSVRPMIYEMVRAGRRQALAQAWYAFTKVCHSWMPLSGHDVLAYRVDRGTEHSEFLPRPSSWIALCAQLEHFRTQANALPSVLREDLCFALLFVLFHPHRLSPELCISVSDRIDALAMQG